MLKLISYFLFTLVIYSQSLFCTNLNDEESSNFVNNSTIILNQNELKSYLNKDWKDTELLISGSINSELDTLLEYTHLKSINFSSGYIEDSTLKKICLSLTNLTSLNIEGSPITNDGISELYKLTNLKIINVKNTLINSDGLKKISSQTKVLK